MHRAQTVASLALRGRGPTTVGNKALSRAEALQLRRALVEDARDAIFSGVLTIGEAVQGLDRKLFTWATVKLYYSVFYLTRAMLGINGIGIFYVKRTPYLWTATAGELPCKRSGTTHAVVLQAFEGFMPGSLLLSQAIGADEPFGWLMAKREEANYKIARFSEPSPPTHFANVERHGVRRLIGNYVADDTHLFTFDPDHAMLAFPIETMKLAFDALRKAGAAGIEPNDTAFLASQCFDRAGPIAEFRRLIVN